MAKWIAAAKARAGLRHAVICPNVTGRTKERIAQSKRARAGSLALVDWPQVARTCILRAFGLQMLCPLSLVLRRFCFVFVSMLSSKPWRPDSHTCFFLFPFVSLEMLLFPSIFVVPLLFSVCMESTSHVFSFRMVFFY